MGIDFLKKTANSFKKSLNRRKAELGRPDLFTRDPSQQPRTYSANLRSGESLTPGDEVLICVEGSHIVARRERRIVARFENPSEEFISALEDGYGEACGEVLDVFDAPGVVEIAVS